MFLAIRVDDTIVKELASTRLKCVLQISAEEYESTSRDPVAAFAKPIASHMNADHADSILAMVKHYVGISVEKAEIEALDR